MAPFPSIYHESLAVCCLGVALECVGDGWAFVIVVLWLATVATTAAFFRSSKIDGWLLVPYLA